MSIYSKASELFKDQSIFAQAMVQLDFHSEDSLTRQFHDLLDETETVKIGTLNYAASWAWQQIDPVAYRQGFLDYIDSLELIEIDGYYFEETQLSDFLELYNK